MSSHATSSSHRSAACRSVSLSSKSFPHQRSCPTSGSRRKVNHNNNRGITVCSANIRKANIRDSHEVLSGITRSTALSGCAAPIDIMLLQEAPTWRSDSQQTLGLPDWHIFGTEGHPCAIVVSDRIRGSIEKFGESDRCAFITTPKYMFVSVYAPDSSHGIAAYTSTWATTGRIIRQHRGRGRLRRRLLIGGDFNHQAQPDIEGVTGPWAQGPRGRRRATKSRFVEAAKTDAIVKLSSELGAAIWTTYPDNFLGSTPGPTTTWRTSDGRSESQLDYFMGDSEVCRMWGTAEPSGRSDHSILWTQVATPGTSRKTRHSRSFTLNGWAPAEAQDMAMFRTHLCGSTQTLGGPHDTTTSATTELMMWERSITQAAGATRQRPRVTAEGRPKCPAELLDMEKEASKCDHDSERRRRLRRECRRRRKRESRVSPMGAADGKRSGTTAAATDPDTDDRGHDE